MATHFVVTVDIKRVDSNQAPEPTYRGGGAPSANPPRDRSITDLTHVVQKSDTLATAVDVAGKILELAVAAGNTTDA